MTKDEAKIGMKVRYVGPVRKYISNQSLRPGMTGVIDLDGDMNKGTNFGDGECFVTFPGDIGDYVLPLSELEPA